MGGDSTGTPMAYSLTSGVWSKLGLSRVSGKIAIMIKATSLPRKRVGQICNKWTQLIQDRMSQQLSMFETSNKQ